MKTAALKMLFVSLTLYALSAGASFAAPIIHGSVSGPLGLTTENLSVYGTEDWAYWSASGNGAGGGLAATNSKADASLIGNLKTIGAGNNSIAALTPGASNNGSTVTFDYTGGVSPASGSIQRPTAFYGNLNSGIGTGLSLSITLPTVNTYEISIWTALQGMDLVAPVSLTAGIGGTTYYTDTSMTSTGASPVGNRNSYRYTLTVTTDSTNQVLDIALFKNISGNNGWLSISGVAVSAVPEPATGALLIGGLALVALRRRRSKR